MTNGKQPCCCTGRTGASDRARARSRLFVERSGVPPQVDALDMTDDVLDMSASEDGPWWTMFESSSNSCFAADLLFEGQLYSAANWNAYERPGLRSLTCHGLADRCPSI